MNYIEELRLLINICILLLKVKRTSIEVTELEKICLETFKIDKASEKLAGKNFGVIKDSVFTVKFSLLYYEEVLKKIEKNKSFKRFVTQWVFENKGCYKGKKIRGLDIWGIGKSAITLGEVKCGDGYRDPGFPSIWCEKKEFHNFFQKINKKNSFDDGIEVAKEIIDEYGLLSWEEKGRQEKEMLEEMGY